MIKEYSQLYKVKLPEVVAKRFWELGEAQRGRPETAMIRLNRFYAGIASPVFEHGGDLTWRISHWAQRGLMDDEVKFKVDRCLRYLTARYPFEKEWEENCVNNARGKEMPILEYKLTFERLRKQYAAEHKKLAVYNRAQWLCREVAVSLGEWKLSECVKLLNELVPICKTDRKLTDAGYAYQLLDNGEPQVYPY